MPARSALLLLATALLFAAPGQAQNSDKDFNFNLHAHAHTSAVDIGLPQYPGSVLDPDKDDDSGQADLGLSVGGFHFKLLVAKYKSADPAWKVFGFYRTALGKYGEVLECEHGKPVGGLATTDTGLTCGDNVNADGDNGRQLRAGSPQKLHILALDDDKQNNKQTRFVLMYVELPKDSGTK